MDIHIYEVTAQTNKYELEEISWRSNMNFPHNTVVPVVVIGLQLAHMGLQEKVLEVLKDPTPIDKAFFFGSGYSAIIISYHSCIRPLNVFRLVESIDIQ